MGFAAGKAAAASHKTLRQPKVLFSVDEMREGSRAWWPGPPGSHQNTAALQGHGVGTASKVTATGVTESTFQKKLVTELLRTS